MKFSFGVYDFLGYTLPGLMIVVILAILINPTLPTNLMDQLNGPKDELPQYLNPNVTLGIFYVFACYVVGLAAHGFINWMFSVLSSTKWCSFKRYAVDSGSFEKRLFCGKYKDYDKDFYPYSDQFVHKLRHQIRKVFGIKVSTIQGEAENKGADVRYTEIFHLCRTAFMKHSPDLYPRASALLSLYNSAKLLGAIFCLAAIGFFLRIVIFQQDIQGPWQATRSPIYLNGLLLFWLVVFIVLWIEEKNRDKKDCPKTDKNTAKKKYPLELLYWGIVGVLGMVARICVEIKNGQTSGLTNLFICYWVSASLCPIFFYLYHLFFRYYRNSILYGFYEYTIDPWRSKEKSQSEA